MRISPQSDGIEPREHDLNCVVSLQDTTMIAWSSGGSTSLCWWVRPTCPGSGLIVLIVKGGVRTSSVYAVAHGFPTRAYVGVQAVHPFRWRCVSRTQKSYEPERRAAQFVSGFYLGSPTGLN